MRSLLAIAVALTMVNVVLSVTCPNPFTASGSGCYFAAPQVSVSWEQAYENCVLDFYGYLVEIESQEEQASIEAYLYTIDPQFRFSHWIGLSDEHDEGIYRWMNSGHYISYTNWAASQPQASTAYNCAKMKGDRLWAMNSCTTLYSDTSSICEADPI